MRKNYELLLQIKKDIEKNPDVLVKLPIKEIVDCVYYELHELRQLYEQQHFTDLGKKMLGYAGIMQSAVDTCDVSKAIDMISRMIDIYDMLPDVEVTLPLIERANFDRALNRHILEGTIVAMGDSHSCFFAGNDDLALLPMLNDISTCVQHSDNPFTVLHLGPCLAYSADKFGSTNRLREKVEWLNDNFLLEGDTVLFSLGEIDVRNHVYKISEETGKDYREIIDEIIAHYLQILIWLKERNYRVIAYGPIGSLKDSAPEDAYRPRVGTEEMRNAAGRYYNQQLEIKCRENGIEFFTLFYDMVDENDHTDVRFLSDDQFHLGQYGYNLAMEKLRDLGVLPSGEPKNNQIVIESTVANQSEQAGEHFDTLIVVTPADCQRLSILYPRIVDNIEYGNLCLVGSSGVWDVVKDDKKINGSIKWIDENKIVPFDEVHACMAKRLAPIIGDKPLPRGITGWYYQQFLKMQYAFICSDEYYMVWDGDTVPCRRIEMFSEEGKPFLDLKHEYHPEYFDTMGKLLPGFSKVIERSFISEHMLFRCDIMRKLIADIESNDQIKGTKFWEKIINAIEPDTIYDSAFSEFETYGTYVALKFPDAYKLREWHSFRLGGSFYEVDTITDGDFNWLGVDFDAISFEKDQQLLEVNKGYFDNPDVQRKISAKKLLQAVQMEYDDAYKEVWDDDLTLGGSVNTKSGGYHEGKKKTNKTLIVLVGEVSDDKVKHNISSMEASLKEGTYKAIVSGDCIGECNRLVRETVGTDFEDADIFLLQADSYLVYDALYFLRQALYASDDIGAVGSVSNLAPNKQQLDIHLDTEEEYIRYGEKINVPMADPCLERTRLSAHAMLIRRDVWNRIGGFDEVFATNSVAEDALSVEILRSGFRLKVVRNSFVYHESCLAGACDGKLYEQDKKKFIGKYGFGSDEFAYASGTVITQMPYSPDDRFAVLQVGCGLGADIKAIRSLYPFAEVYGIELDSRVQEIGRKTEKIFGSLDELLEFFNSPYFSVMIIDSEIYKNLVDSVSEILSGLLFPNPVIITRNAQYERLDFEKIKLIIWNMDDTFWQGKISDGEVIVPLANVELVKSIADHGIVNSITCDSSEDAVMEELSRNGIDDLFVCNSFNVEDQRPDVSEKLNKMGISPENVLLIGQELTNELQNVLTAGPDVLPYLNLYYSRLKATDPEHTELKRYIKD